MCKNSGRYISAASLDFSTSRRVCCVCCVVLCCAVLCCAVLCSVVLCRVVSCRVVSCRVVRLAVSCCVVLCLCLCLCALCVCLCLYVFVRVCVFVFVCGVVGVCGVFVCVPFLAATSHPIACTAGYEDLHVPWRPRLALTTDPGPSSCMSADFARAMPVWQTLPFALVVEVRLSERPGAVH
jgi:hypothetical protein